jgi:hypothetical protein
MADVLETNAPALSATSDAPIPGAEPSLSEEVNKTVDNLQEKPEIEATGGDKSPGEEKVEPKPDLTPPAVKREITKARNAQRAADERAARLETQLAQALEGLAKVAKPEVKEDPRPQRDAFNDPDAYDAALIEWSGKGAAAKAVAEADAARIRGETASRVKALTDSWAERKAAFVDDHPDYEDVAEEADENGKDLVSISIPMAHAIMNAEDGPAIAYWLGQNRADAARIAKLDPVQAVVEIGRISAKLANAPKPRTPKPDPLRPLGSRSAAGNGKDPSEMSTEEYAAYIAHRLPYGRPALTN